MNNKPMPMPMPTPQSLRSDYLRVIHEALNRGCQKGIYNLDEAYLIKTAFNTIEKFIIQVEADSQKTVPHVHNDTKNNQDDEALTVDNIKETLQRAAQKTGKQVKFNESTDNATKSV